MLFKTSELDAAKAAVVKAAASDSKKLKALDAEFQSLRPQWEELEEEAEYRSALYDGNDRAYAVAVAEVFWNERMARLKAEIADLVARRDALTTPLLKEIAEVKGRLHRRRGIVTGGFGSWVNSVQSMLPPAIAEELGKARTAVEKCEDLAEAIGIAEGWINRIAEYDEGPTSVPLLNLGRLLRQAASVE